MARLQSGSVTAASTRRTKKSGIRLGEPPTPVPEPFASLLLRAVNERENMNTATNPAARWLFPGRRAGQPLNVETLRTCIRGLGIPSAATRVAAVRQLVLQAPAPVVATALGFCYGGGPTSDREPTISSVRAGQQRCAGGLGYYSLGASELPDTVSDKICGRYCSPLTIVPGAAPRVCEPRSRWSDGPPGSRQGNGSGTLPQRG
jgi:hypothetical protein